MITSIEKEAYKIYKLVYDLEDLIHKQNLTIAVLKAEQIKQAQAEALDQYDDALKTISHAEAWELSND